MICASAIRDLKAICDCLGEKEISLLFFAFFTSLTLPIFTLLYFLALFSNRLQSCSWHLMIFHILTLSWINFLFLFLHPLDLDHGSKSGIDIFQIARTTLIILLCTNAYVSLKHSVIWENTTQQQVKLGIICHRMYLTKEVRTYRTCN